MLKISLYLRMPYIVRIDFWQTYIFRRAFSSLFEGLELALGEI